MLSEVLDISRQAFYMVLNAAVRDTENFKMSSKVNINGH